MTAAWEAQNTAATTARIEFDLYRYYNGAGTADRAAASAAVGAATSPRPDFDAIRKRLTAVGGTAGLWPVGIDVVQSPDGIRNTWSTGDTVVWNGKEEVRRRRDNNQVDVHKGRTNGEIFTDGLLRVSWDPAALRMGQQRPAAGGRVLVRFDSPARPAERVEAYATEVEFSPQTGHLHSVRRYGRGDLARPFFESVQAGPTEYPGRAVFPMVKVDVEYSGDSVKFIDIYHIKSVHLGEIVDPKEFAVDVPRNATVVDGRNPAATRAFTAQRAADDVVAYVGPEPSADPPPAEDAPSARTGRWWYWAGGAALIATAASRPLWRRLSPRRP